VEDFGVLAQDGFKLVQPCFQLATIASAETGLLSFLVLAGGAVARAPAARRLTAITFYLCRLVHECMLHVHDVK
jgi:hypothetical protein